MSKGLEQCDKCDYFISVEDAYKQGREDAIDAFVEKCKVKIQEQNIEMEDECPFLDYIDIYKIAEQLKEEK